MAKIKISFRKIKPGKEERSKAKKPKPLPLASDADVLCDNFHSADLMKQENEDPLRSTPASITTEKSAYARVKATIRTFNTYYLQFVQKEEQRCEKLEDQVKRQSKRPDLKAINKMMEAGEILYHEKMIGDLEGIDVGHQFYSRAEMVVLGMHSHWLNGIDYMGQKYKKEKAYSSYSFPLAISIVISGEYEDNLDISEEVVYTGQGGHNLLGDKRQIGDQHLVRGNLALKHNMEHLVPVRLIRGHSSPDSYTGKIYTYDGLYRVIEYWAQKGVAGFRVYKYRLRRIEGQPKLTTEKVSFIRRQGRKSIASLEGEVCKDISGGQENFPIPATNVIDDPPVAPTAYVYSKSVQVGSGIELPEAAVGCKCKGECRDEDRCACARLNGSEFPYVRSNGGRLIEAKAVVFECGPKCGCGPNCVNRTSQQGLKYRLEVFRTDKKGWGVRSWDPIPSGAPVCEYTGVLKRTSEMDQLSTVRNEYVFDIDCLETMQGLDGRERRMGSVSDHAKARFEKSHGSKGDSMPEFCIDGGTVGNVSRFINHSCQPNLFVQCVLSSHHDIRLARIVLFAAEHIPPLQELSYDYGYALGSVVGPDGRVIKLPCHCGAPDCRKRLY